MSGETSSLSGGVEEAPAPRLCHLIKWPDFDGYGFNLHAERSNPGQFIGKIDAESPAQMAGLREGDRIIEVNGVNIANENHRQVVERIKALENEARLLVVDAEADLWYRERELVVKASQMNVIYIKTPVPRPAPDSPRSKARVDSSRPPAAATAAARSPSEPAGEQQQQQQQDGGAPASGDAPAAAGEQQGEQQKGDERASEAPEQQQQQQEASSLTSDFNEDSIEPQPPQPARHEQQPSGVLTVEAEINRQTAAAHVDEAARSRKQQLVEEVKRQVGGARRARETAAEEAAEVGAAAKTNDAKTNDDDERQQQQQIEPDSLQPEGATIDAKERARQVHNRSADSGKSSSRDTATSGAESDNTGSHSSLAADSLEGELAAAQPQLAPAPGRKESGGGAVESGGKQPPASSVAPATPEVAVAAAAAAEHGGPGKAHRAAGPQDSTDSAGSTGSISGHNNNNNNNIDRGENHVTYAKAPPQEQEQQQATSPTSTTNSTTAGGGGAAVAPAGQPQQQQQQLSNNNNNNNSNKAGGCLISNLNMTASQMRELIASRKKIDPKKAQMNIRQKYEIIQQM